MKTKNLKIPTREQYSGTKLSRGKIFKAKMSPSQGSKFSPEDKGVKRRRTDVLFDIPTRNSYKILESVMDTDLDCVEDVAEKETAKSGKTTTASASIAATVNTSKPTPSSNTNKTRIPPITVMGRTRQEVVDWCTSHDIKKYRLKMTSTGINLFCDTIDDFKTAKKLMKENEYAYYTHALPEEREFRVILKGLFDMEAKELLDALKEAKITPTTVRQLNPKRVKYDGQAHYILSFPIGSTKMSILKQCKYLCHLVVEWDFYQPRKYGPTRCHNCNRFGHGKSQCSMQSRCPVCAGSHTLEACPNVSEDGRLKDGCKFKCPNCSEEHPSTFEQCPKLIEYLQIQERIAAKNSTKNSAKPLPRQNVLNPRDFPPLPQQRPFPTGTQRSSPSTPWHPQASDTSTDLMSVDELLQLSQELIISLRSCRTRQDQFNAVARLALKFVGNHGSP